MADPLRRHTPCVSSKELRRCCAVLGRAKRRGLGDVTASPGRCLGICTCAAKDQTQCLLHASQHSTTELCSQPLESGLVRAPGSAQGDSLHRCGNPSVAELHRRLRWAAGPGLFLWHLRCAFLSVGSCFPPDSLHRAEMAPALSGFSPSG